MQMFGSGIRQAKIVVYQLTEKDYDDFFRPIEPKRRRIFDVPYDDKWVQGVYLPKHLRLRDCLVKGVLPDEINL